MRRDVHLDVGTRVINTKTGRLGQVTEPFYLCRPEYHEITINWDGSRPETSECVDRADIEYEGSEEYKSALKRFGHAK